MTEDQIMAFSIIGLMMAVFIWDRFRYDLVAVFTLLISCFVGLVSPKEAFSGFSSDIVIIVGSVFIISAAVSRSGVMEFIVQRIWPDVKSIRLQLAFLVICVVILSTFVKNIGALAIMLPIAFQFSRRSQVAPSLFLMPMAFGALLGGLMTQIGTSPNVVISAMRERLVGIPFTMFDFTPVGATVAAVGILYLVFFSWRLPVRVRSGVSFDDAIDIRDYVSEVRIPANSSIIGKTIIDLVKPSGGEVMVTQVVRNKISISPFPDFVLSEGDTILLEGSHTGLDMVINSARLEFSTGHVISAGDKDSDVDIVEAVVTHNSSLIGISIEKFLLFDHYDVNLLALSRQHERLRGRLGDVVFRLGDVIILQGRDTVIPNLLRELKCLPLAKRNIVFGNLRHGLVSLSIIFVAIILTAFQITPVAFSFFTAATAMVVFRVLPVRDLYQALDGQILVLLAALIPVSEVLEKTGCTNLIGHWLSQVAVFLPPSGALALMLVTAMLVTPFLNNAATVMMVAPIASSFAHSLHYKPEAFLMAVAIGAGCEFLTPIGHQCNMLIMGPGGYRFSDYIRFGAPLAVLIAVVAVPMLMWVWPLQ
ncbi:transporter, TrkA family [Bartonella australis AUST/NH1]|uniref:Transporter, TrkA family n=1 Tax=Bartonella australis (strain Aust/NH1) TaxID=1094489 RepID=M1NS92_BARAA|nr:SLC13 family permease [Bartonella australis]AGF74218.1 transporter, TrkA family [Bartonella australis AUST/NH1]